MLVVAAGERERRTYQCAVLRSWIFATVESTLRADSHRLIT
jgi:hypothetical protein